MKRTIWILAIGLLVALSAGVFFSSPKRLSVETRQTAWGWGYQIRQNSKVLIDQPTIPAISGSRGFATKQQAKQVGELVVLKIKNGQSPPTLSFHELDSLGVIY